MNINAFLAGVVLASTAIGGVALAAKPGEKIYQRGFLSPKEAHE